MNTGIGSSGEPRVATAKANDFDIVYRAWLWDDNSAFAKALELALRYSPETYCLVFAPEGLPFDPCPR
jgi:hypothetical protein